MSSPEAETNSGPTKSTFLNFSFFKVDPKWRWLNEVAKEEASKEFASLLDVANTKMKVRSYSTIGLRSDSDLMLWMISDTVEKMQILASRIYNTVFGKYISASHVFLSAARASVYSQRAIPGFLTGEAPMTYLVAYPFVKSREWYLLPFEKRKDLMAEHIGVGRKFPEVRLNTTYSFGLDDQDFMLAFETENLEKFQDLIMQLRETQVSRYVIRDTPMIVCVYKGVEDIMRSLG